MLANCIPDGMFLGTFVGIMALDAAMIGFGAWMLTKGRSMQNRAEGVAYTVIGGIIAGVFSIPWAVVAWRLIPQ